MLMILLSSIRCFLGRSIKEVRVFQWGTFNIEILCLLIIHRVLWTSGLPFPMLKLQSSSSSSFSSGIDESIDTNDDSDGDDVRRSAFDSEKHRPRLDDVFRIPRVGTTFPDVSDSVVFGVTLLNVST